MTSIIAQSFKHAAVLSGLSGITGPFNFFDNGGQSSKDDSNIIGSGSPGSSGAMSNGMRKNPTVLFAKTPDEGSMNPSRLITTSILTCTT